MEGGYISAVMTRDLMVFANPLKSIRMYDDQDARGMDFWHDVRDWLGGFPYEYATVNEVFDYLHGKCALELEYLSSCVGHGCNEFAFRRPAAR